MRFIFFILALLVASACTAEERDDLICSGKAVCVRSPYVGWGMGTTVVVTLEKDVGCPVDAIYQVYGEDLKGNRTFIMSLSSSNPTFQMTKSDMYKKFTVVPSDKRGCTDLDIVLHIRHTRG